MSVFKIEKNKNYTVMSNYHLRDKNLSYKAKGLLSFMLSLPEDWDYSLNGLCAISKESKDGIRSILKELQEHHYIERANLIKEKGFFIRPSELFCNVIKSVKSDSATFTDVEGKTKSVKDNLNEYLEKIINESISRK